MSWLYVSKSQQEDPSPKISRSVLWTGYLALGLNLQNEDQVTPAINGPPPSQGWSPNIQIMVPHFSMVGHANSNGWPPITSRLVTQHPKDDHPPSKGWYPTHHPKNFTHKPGLLSKPQPQHNTTQRLGLTWNWLCKPPHPTPHTNFSGTSRRARELKFGTDTH